MGSIHQPIEIDQMPTAYKTQWVEEIDAGGIAGDHSPGITGLTADKGGQVLCAGGGPQIEIEGVETRTQKLIQDTRGENTPLTAPLADEGDLPRAIRLIS
ncbi:hypothetical protein EDWATA_00437 [Edwardsiella tarda ATCC 23685]|uniref:Uncharacterized protein n=1 Tax=Edwardsiella tarda ATCC 23685 TaxID=500638 RepID=D4F153_EDWTA|nr:hypothetical protein EDWATA_00437 [Edwardsiella tarda ATCC 23685]